MSNNLLALLPEIILTVAGVLIMLAEPMIAPGKSRKPLGWLAILGTIGSMGAAVQQHIVTDRAGNLPITAFYGTIQFDNFSVFFHLLIACIVLAVLLASLDYFEGPVSHAGEYFALLCFGATGMMLMTSSVELLLVFIGLEISSITTYILAGFRKGQATASESSLKYFLLGSFATAFTLYGIALAFGATGSTSLAVLAMTLHSSMTPTLALLAVAMMLIGFGFKVSAAPFHVWTPDVYQGAPAPVVALMSTAPKAAVFAVLLRLLFNGAPALRGEWLLLVTILAVASMCIGNLGALAQKDVKRLLAYSSIAHAGYLLVAFTCFQADAVSAACFYTAAYAAMNVGALLVITQLGGFDEHLRSIEDFTGVGLKRPFLTALLGFFLVSMIGIPFTGGFFGKFYVFSAAVHAGHTWLAVVGLLNSGVACFYYIRLLVALYSKPAAQKEVSVGKASPVAAVALIACALGTLALGIAPGKLLNLLQRSAPTLETGPSESELQPAAVPTSAVASITR
ncbi:NADH-quinone oxidoreductase subunit N [Granulicella cerasi]|uniref:NADH-quinone oxidoreductase subunit N n=1 Tax=Granulicella cerasi TaxID=741063 RepID=A0ABW1Z5E9_9BACT|nr:NADH-quinone oxidoreductase subunit N [Granulicella cerasi]